jgi:hypothetical protein
MESFNVFDYESWAKAASDPLWISTSERLRCGKVKRKYSQNFNLGGDCLWILKLLAYSGSR